MAEKRGLWSAQSEGLAYQGQLVQVLHWPSLSEVLSQAAGGWGQDHVIQVVDAQGEQRIGLEDESPLAGAETRSVELETRPRLSPPAGTTGQADDSIDLALIAVIVVLYSLIALVLIAIIVVVASRLRRS